MPRGRQAANDAFAAPLVDSAPVSTRNRVPTGPPNAGVRIVPLSRRAFAVLSGLLLALAITAPAFAHADLVRSSPKDKAVLETPPTKVTLTFSEALDPGKSSFKLVWHGRHRRNRQGDRGEREGDGARRADPGPRRLRGPLDGRRRRTGTSSAASSAFTVAEPTPRSGNPGFDARSDRGPNTRTVHSRHSRTNDRPAIGPESATPAPDTPAPGDDAMPAATSTTDMLIPIVVGLIVVAGIGALVLRRSRRA